MSFLKNLFRKPIREYRIKIEYWPKKNTRLMRFNYIVECTNITEASEAAFEFWSDVIDKRKCSIKLLRKTDYGYCLEYVYELMQLEQ